MTPQKAAIHEVDFCGQIAMPVKWFRVLYRPHGTRGFWTYGWSFPSDSLIHANETLDQTCRVKDKGRWTYQVREIIPGDIDYPKEDDSSTSPSVGTLGMPRSFP